MAEKRDLAELIRDIRIEAERVVAMTKDDYVVRGVDDPARKRLEEALSLVFEAKCAMAQARVISNHRMEEER